MDNFKYSINLFISAAILLSLIFLTLTIYILNSTIKIMDRKLNLINQQGAVLNSKTNYIINLVITPTPSPKPTNAK